MKKTLMIWGIMLFIMAAVCLCAAWLYHRLYCRRHYGRRRHLITGDQSDHSEKLLNIRMNMKGCCGIRGSLFA